MLTMEEKFKEVEIAMSYIEAINHVLRDAIWQAEASGDGDYVILLEFQKKYIRKITDLF